MREWEKESNAITIIIDVTFVACMKAQVTVNIVNSTTYRLEEARRILSIDSMLYLYI